MNACTPTMIRNTNRADNKLCKLAVYGKTAPLELFLATPLAVYPFNERKHGGDKQCRKV